PPKKPAMRVPVGRGWPPLTGRSPVRQWADPGSGKPGATDEREKATLMALVLPRLRIGQITDLHARDAQPGASSMPVRRSREMLRLLPAALERMKALGAQF